MSSIATREALQRQDDRIAALSGQLARERELHAETAHVCVERGSELLRAGQEIHELHDRLVAKAATIDELRADLKIEYEVVTDLSGQVEALEDEVNVLHAQRMFPALKPDAATNHQLRSFSPPSARWDQRMTDVGWLTPRRRGRLRRWLRGR